MGKINVLTRDVYTRIAAGEVIDRPYSAVKELVENSLDAGATEIKIYIENGGKQLIKVVDNGCGIEKDDLRNAFLPHATSKISSAADLEKITTLGFRGEALASIAVVARVELTSVTQGNGAFKVVCENEKVSEAEPAALEKGTVICVRDLFYNTPVREKFMKTDKKEESDITNFVTRFILGNPKVSFKYYINGKLNLQSYGGGLDEAVAQVYGAKTIAECYKIDAEKHGIKVFGFIGNQNFFKPNKTYQSIFLNGRYIVNNAIAMAISNAYASYAMKRQYPFYVLNVTVPGDMVDVNVHPSKSDVRFVDSRLIFGAVYNIVSSVLDGTAKAADFVLNSKRLPEIKSTSGEATLQNIYTEETADGKSIVDGVVVDAKIFRSSSEPEEKSPEDKWYYNPVEEKTVEQFMPPRTVGQLALNDELFTTMSELKKYEAIRASEKRAEYERQMIEYERCKFKGSLFNTYLIYEIADSVYLIDQHAAHERLLFDNLLRNLNKRKIMKQGLITPYVFHTNPQEHAFIEENLHAFERIGFTLSDYGFGSYKIDEVPLDLVNIDIKKFFNEILSNIDDLKEIKLEDVLKDKLAMTACKHAIKGGQALNDQEVTALFAMLKGNVGLKCPHGRPICVKLTKTQLDKMFKRIVN